MYDGFFPCKIWDAIESRNTAATKYELLYNPELRRRKNEDETKKDF